MKKNLFDEHVQRETIARAMLLADTSERLWGTLTPAQMLKHCTEVLLRTTENYTPKAENFKQKTSRFLMLNIIPRFPQGAKTPAQVDVRRSNIATAALETEREQFKKQLEDFCSFNGQFTLTHPYFGNLTRIQWGILTWMHLDHHLRQFGV